VFPHKDEQLQDICKAREFCNSRLCVLITDK